MKLSTEDGSQYWAAVVQRVSGVVLALFLPVHFWVLGLALEKEQALDGFFRWADQPAVKIAEAGLVVLLAVHLMGGVRLLMIELLPWRDWQRSLVSVSGAFAAAAGVAFLVNAF